MLRRVEVFHASIENEPVTQFGRVPGSPAYFSPLPRFSGRLNRHSKPAGPRISAAEISGIWELFSQVWGDRLVAVVWFGLSGVFAERVCVSMGLPVNTAAPSGGLAVPYHGFRPP